MSAYLSLVVLSWCVVCPAPIDSSTSAGLLSLVHLVQPFVKIVRGEVCAVVPRDGSQAIVQKELREFFPIPQRLELLAVELIGEIDHAFSSIVELEPYLVVADIPCFHHMTWDVLVLGHLPVSSGYVESVVTPSRRCQNTPDNL